MYCSIEDAWGSDFNRESKPVESDKPAKLNTKSNKSISVRENFNDTTETDVEQQLYDQYLKLKNKFDNDDKNKVCNAVNKHIKTCATCRARYLQAQQSAQTSNQFSLNLPSVSSITNKLNENSDAVTLILICILILLIIKLFNKP